MESFRIIPAIDLIDGQCVRLLRGDYQQKTVYQRDPVELAKAFLDAGLDWLHVVDLDGARTGQPENLETVEAIAKTGIKIELGGGLRGKEHFIRALDSGVEALILGSLLVNATDAELEDWSASFPQKFIAGIDAKEGKVAIHGWNTTTTVAAVELVKKAERQGFLRVIYTDIARDGTLAGPNWEELERIARQSALPVVASGGISGMDDIRKVREYASLGVTGVIVGKAFYEGKITIEDLKQC
ncbi:MAG: 1-(5-phosphoribosyl)-5-[(5-phosphoribosylamino)methylideneamino]imidazole-4-carboxamide isomerase [FCB group bacterium]|nr:1-(5-phosphoribosyl)-5-[(5-phosphoribosylamino)methylideneamino]imidazole-4-carboxamide isomerase [FCB group bacterium]